MMVDPDHGHSHSHAHGLGSKWLDITLALSAVAISVISLVVSIQHGRTMEKMVDQNERMVVANTIPILDFGGSEVDGRTGAPRLSMTLKNGGVGPALIDWFEIRYRGVSAGTAGDLLRACCKSADVAEGRLPEGVYYANVSGDILPARETVEPIVVTEKAPKALFTELDAARSHMEARACYCSVLEECWLTDFGAERPKPVKTCSRPSDVKPW